VRSDSEQSNAFGLVVADTTSFPNVMSVFIYRPSRTGSGAPSAIAPPPQNTRGPHLNRGYYVRPTVFANVRNDMTIAREEIFGPVIVILPHKDETKAIIGYQAA
jgi:hypothetical protein